MNFWLDMILANWESRFMLSFIYSELDNKGGALLALVHVQAHFSAIEMLLGAYNSWDDTFKLHSRPSLPIEAKVQNEDRIS